MHNGIGAHVPDPEWLDPKENHRILFNSVNRGATPLIDLWLLDLYLNDIAATSKVKASSPFHRGCCDRFVHSCHCWRCSRSCLQRKHKWNIYKQSHCWLIKAAGMWAVTEWAHKRQKVHSSLNNLHEDAVKPWVHMECKETMQSFAWMSYHHRTWRLRWVCIQFCSCSGKSLGCSCRSLHTRRCSANTHSRLQKKWIITANFWWSLRKVWENGLEARCESLSMNWSGVSNPGLCMNDSQSQTLSPNTIDWLILDKKHGFFLWWVSSLWGSKIGHSEDIKHKPLQLIPSESRVNPVTQSHLLLPLVLTHVWLHPPFSTRHSSVSASIARNEVNLSGADPVCFEVNP